MWKWLVFGPLLLLATDIIPANFDKITPLLAAVLGFAITIRMIALPKVSWLLKILTGWGLTILIGVIASLLLFGTCLLPLKLNFCAPNALRANIFSNFAFPMIAVLVWSLFEGFQAIQRLVGYFFAIKKARKIR